MARTGRIVALFAALALIAGGAAWAEEILYFTNGTSMPIRSHEVRGEMIHVDLGDEAFMAFPMKMIDKIEAAGKEVALSPSFGRGNRQAGRGVADNEGSFPVKGRAPSRFSKSKTELPDRGAVQDPNVDVENGVTVYRPHAGASGARGRLAASGHRRALSAREGGSTRFGNRTVIGAPASSANNRKAPIVGLQQVKRQAGQTRTTSESDAGGSGSGSSSSSSSSSSGSGGD